MSDTPRTDALKTKQGAEEDTCGVDFAGCAHEWEARPSLRTKVAVCRKCLCREYTTPPEPEAVLISMVGKPGPETSEIRLKDDKTLDEVVGEGVDAHLEHLDKGHWFLCIGDVAVWLYSKKKIHVSYERRETAEILRAHLTELSAGVSKLRAEVEKTVGPRPRKFHPKEPERDR